jgi:hypothetical protein
MRLGMFADRIGYGLIRLLAEIQKHIVEDEKLIREAFKEHPDAELFRDLPGGGVVLAPRLLVAFGTDRTHFHGTCPHALTARSNCALVILPPQHLDA